MSYRLFKLVLEMNHFDTFEKDHIVQKKYQTYLEECKKKDREKLPVLKVAF